MIRVDIGELNPRFIMWCILGLVGLAIIILPLFIREPNTEEIKNPIITQVEYITIMVTPTPDGIKIFSNEFENGTRLIGRPFSWIREDVLGYQDMKVTTTVYDYIMLDKLHWFNPSDYKYYEQEPSREDMKFLFVLFNIYMDDKAGEDTRMWLPKDNLMNVLIGNKIYSPLDYPKQIRFKELENTYNMNDDSIIQAYGQFKTYEKGNPKTAGEISEEHYYLRGGKSNAEDGYIMFEIPKDTKAEDIIFRANFYDFGYSAWRLKK